MAEISDDRRPLARDGLSLLAILLVAGALRAFAWSQTVVLFNDGPIFLAMAEAIQAGRWAEVLAHPFHPLYPAMIALVAQGPIDLESAAVAVSILGGLLSILGIFVFVSRAFGRDAAWLSAWTVAMHPWAVDFSSDVMSDGLYAGLFLVGFALLSALVEAPRLATALGCGLAAGLAYLVRPEGAGLIVAGGLLLTMRWVTHGADRRRTIVAGAGLVLSAAIVMAPLLGSIAQQTGDVSLTRKKSLAALANGHPGVQLERAGAEGSASWAANAPIPLPRSSERVMGNGSVRPERSLLGFAGAVSRAVRTSLASLRYEVAAFAVLGLWAIRGRRRPLREATVALSATLYTGLLVLLVWGAGYVARRHALAALLPLTAYAALGWRTLCTGLVDWLSPERPVRASRLKSAPSICVLLVVVLVAVWGARDLRPRRADREPVRLAAEWLAQNGEGGASVAAQKLRVAYYASANFVPLPSGVDGRIESHLRDQGVGWIVIDEGRLEDHLGLAPGLGRWLFPIHSVERAGRRALVLELRREAGDLSPDEAT